MKYQKICFLLSKDASVLQTIQNNMIRLILDLKKKNHVNMQKVRERIKMMSINQMAVYHTLLEAFNVIRNSSSEQIQIKWAEKCENKYLLRSSTNNDLKVPKKPMMKSSSFSYSGAKLFNMLPSTIKEAGNSKTFKALMKNWIWEKIPSY